MKNMTDIYCDIIDNYGDIAFAIKVINTYFFEKKENNFRFFSNNKPLFEIFSKNLLDWIEIEYFDISEIKKSIPSQKIFNLFERKIDYAFLESFDFEIHLINFSYFSLETYSSKFSPWIQDFHGKISQHKNLKVENFAVSLLPNTGWVFPEWNYYSEIFIREYFEKNYRLPKNKKYISIFCYPKTLQKLQEQKIFENIWENVLICSFWTQIWTSENFFEFPFLNMKEYFSFLHYCTFNIVRGENSIISALQRHNIPFYYDIYKEKNWAHIAKIHDFCEYLKSQNFEEIFLEMQKEGNIDWNYSIIKNFLS